MSLDGFNPQLSFGDSISGYEPSFYLDKGFPAYSTAPNVSLGADNGTNGPNYRPTYANHLSYTQQWNLTVERKIGNSSFASVAYVGNKGTHLPSALQPLNYLNPALLTSMGSTELNTVFQPGQTSLYGVSVPYADWAQTLNNGGTCKPTVAQALVATLSFAEASSEKTRTKAPLSTSLSRPSLRRASQNGIYLRAQLHLLTAHHRCCFHYTSHGRLRRDRRRDQSLPGKPEQVALAGRHSEYRLDSRHLRPSLWRREEVHAAGPGRPISSLAGGRWQPA